jgi:hypothetical protein
MTIQPNPPSPQPGNGGSFQTMFGGDYTDIAANRMQQGSGYNSIKKVNGINVDKYALIQRFKTNRSNADQTQYKKDITLLKSLGYVTGKNPSRASIEKGYTNFATDFYTSGANELTDYVTQRLSSTDATYTGSRTTTTRQLTSQSEAVDLITTAYRDYLNLIPGQKTITKFVNDLKKLESSLSAKTITTRDANGNAVVTTVGGVATNADKEGLVLNFIGKVLEKQGIKNPGPALNTGLTAIRKFASDYGIVVPDGDIRKYALQYLQDGKLDNVAEKLKTIAKVSYPTIAPFIDQGLNVRDIASQYMAKKSQLLEIPLELVNPFDKDVVKGFSSMMAPDEFENMIRNNPLWEFTKNAREKTASTVNNILRRFGLV